MADEEKADIGGPTPDTDTKTKTTHKHTTHKKKGTRKKSTKHHAEPATTHAKPEEAKPAGYAFPIEKALVALLVVAVLVIGYMLVTNLRGGTASAGTSAAANDNSQAAGTNTPTPTGEKAKLDFYVMSHCPYGIEVMDAIAPVLKQMGSSVDFSINYIADDSGNGSFSSLHGPTEVDDDLRELCAMKYYPDSYKWMDFVACRDKSPQGTDWQSCATQNGMDPNQINTCATGDEGKQLLSASIQASNKAGAGGSPTMFLNGQSYNGGRKSVDFTRAICNALNTKPDACNNLPQPVSFQVTVINDNRCSQCNTAGLESRLKSMFPGAVITDIDYSSPDAKTILGATGQKYLPVMLFDNKVTQDPGYSDIKNYLVQAGTYLNLRIGSSWDPYCDADSTHCGEDQCKGRMSCRPETPKKLDIYVMSHCPFGIQALNAMKEVLTTLTDASFSIHYIGSYDQSTGQFNSLHGPTEVDDDMRELCVMKYYPNNNQFMNFIWCRNNDTQGDWQKCVTDNGMDAAKIKTCAEGDEGKNMLIASFAESDALGVTASPTWLANNRNKFSALAANDIKTNYCKYNAGATGCDKTLSSSTGAVPAGGGCGT